MKLIRNILWVSLLLIGSLASAQVEEEIVEDVPEMVDMEVEADYPRTYSTRPNSNYQEQQLFGNYKLVYTTLGNSYQRVYGVKEGNKMILPVMFTYNYGNNQDNIILGLGNKYGIFNVQTKKWDIPMMYTNITALGKDLYKVGTANSYGIVDKYNTVLVDFKWSDIRTIYGLENYVIVRDNSAPSKLAGVYSIIARKLVIEPKYKSITKLNTDDLFKVQNELNQTNIMDFKGNVKLKTWYDQLHPEKGGRSRYIVSKGNTWGIIDMEEKEIVPMTYRNIRVQPFSDGSYLAQNKDGKFGLMTIDGEVTLPFNYDNLQFQSYSGVGISSADSKCGVVKVNNGKPYELATCDYDNIVQQNNIFIVEDKKKFGIMDVYGKITTEIKYDELIPMDGKNFKAKLKDKYYLINSKGETISESGYLELLPINSNNRNGSYYNNRNFSYYKTKMSNGKYGIMDKAGLAILGGTFEDIISENSNQLVVTESGKTGIYNLYKRTYDIKPEYDQVVQKGSIFYGFKGNDIYTITLGSSAKVQKVQW